MDLTTAVASTVVDRPLPMEDDAAVAISAEKAASRLRERERLPVTRSGATCIGDVVYLPTHNLRTCNGERG